MTRMKKRQPYRVVNRSHQYRFLAIILIYNLIIVGFLAVVLFVPDIIKMQDQELSIEARAMAADKILTLHSRVWPTIIALICVIGLHSFRGFNRFVGPLYRFTVAFERVRDGKLDFRVALRKKDLLHQEAAILNEMLDVVSKKLGHIQAASLESSKLLNKLESKERGKNGMIESDRENLTRLRQNLDELVASADYFKTEQT
jgi:methyl-accepting chemotaxis protein